MSTNADWPPEKVKAAIYEKGVSMESLAIGAGRSASVVRIALRRKCPTGERVVAELLGIPAHEIWPSRYHPDGRSISRPTSPADVTAKRRAAHRQIRGVA